MGSESPTGKLVVISGPSGSGKSTVVTQLIQKCPLPLMVSVSATTRLPRPGEVDGREYYFLSSEEFQARWQRGEFLECAEVFGKWYGTLCSEVEGRLAAGQWVILEIDVQGAMTIAQLYPDAITIFLKTPSLEEYARRLRHRGTEDEAEIHRRLATAQQELSFAEHYRYQVLNDELEPAVEEICHILRRSGGQTHVQ